MQKYPTHRISCIRKLCHSILSCSEKRKILHNYPMLANPDYKK